MKSAITSVRRMIDYSSLKFLVLDNQSPSYGCIVQAVNVQHIFIRNIKDISCIEALEKSIYTSLWANNLRIIVNNLQYSCKQSTINYLQSNLANLSLRFYLRPFLQAQANKVLARIYIFFKEIRKNHLKFDPFNFWQLLRNCLKIFIFWYTRFIWHQWLFLRWGLVQGIWVGLQKSPKKLLKWVLPVSFRTHS